MARRKVKKSKQKPIAPPPPDLPKRSVGRPRNNVDPEQVRRLAMINCSYAEMAAVLNCDESYLTKNFSQVIKDGREQGTMSLKRAQWTSAMKGNTQMLIWLGKNRLGQKDKTETVHRFADPYAAMSDEELELEERKFRALEAPKPTSRALTPISNHEVIDIGPAIAPDEGSDSTGTDT